MNKSDLYVVQLRDLTVRQRKCEREVCEKNSKHFMSKENLIEDVLHGWIFC